ncbi:hypothetical protein FP744_10000004 [Trichoderma asperellum]
MAMDASSIAVTSHELEFRGFSKQCILDDRKGECAGYALLLVIILSHLTRSHKYGERDHKGLADGSVSPTEQLPRFFAKSGYVDTDPKKVKKDGCGKGNWGSMGEEVVDENFRFTNARRRSNSFSHHNLSDFKTKFEVNEMDPLFDESLHGPIDEENGDDLSKTDSTESVHSV